MWLVFSDLDGTLLDHDTYSFEAARPALARLERDRIPLVLVTSKTRAETEVWRARLGNLHPFIVENGGAAFLPESYFPFPAEGAARRDGYRILEFGERYERLVEALRLASAESGCRVEAFHQMSDAEAAAACDLPVAQAALAKKREYDEPFRILDQERAGALLDTIQKRGFRWTRGGRFHHIMGDSDKAAAVEAVRDLYGKLEPVRTLGLGDGLNDAGFLRAMDVAVVMPSRSAQELRQAVPGGRLAGFPGPRGWNQAVLEVIPD